MKTYFLDSQIEFWRDELKDLREYRLLKNINGTLFAKSVKIQFFDEERQYMLMIDALKKN